MNTMYIINYRKIKYATNETISRRVKFSQKQ